MFCSKQLRNARSAQEGFTLIELLVVILIIGVLAAIAIPTFLSQRSKGQDACAKSLVHNSQIAIETYHTERNTYSGATVPALTSIDATILATACGSVSNLVTGVNGTDVNCTGGVPGPVGGFCTLQMAGNGSPLRYCSPVGVGSCPASGRW
jgi:type IV pilus assembly protein PilA